MPKQIENLNVLANEVLQPPHALKEGLEAPSDVIELVSASRNQIRNILEHRDHRMLVVVGPCSIHDVDAAMDYAERLKNVANRTSDSLYIVIAILIFYLDMTQLLQLLCVS